MFRARAGWENTLLTSASASSSTSTEGAPAGSSRKGHGLRRKPRRLRALIIGGAAVVAAAIGSLSLVMSTISHPLLLNGSCVHEAGVMHDRTPLVNDISSVGVMYICWDSGCDAELICTSVTSLRRAGGWRGKVFVLTDQYEKLEYSKKYCFGYNDSEMTPARELFQTVRAPPAAHQMLMKDWKRRMFELLPDKLSTAIYIDADNFVVGCFEDFLFRHVLRRDAVPTTTEMQEDSVHEPVGDNDDDGGGARGNHAFKQGDEDGKIYMLPDNVCIGCNVFNGGFMVVNKGLKSQACLNEWLAETAKGDHRMYGKDQVALDAVLHRSNNPCSDAIVELPHSEELYMDYLLLPAIFRSITTHRRPTLQHFTTGIRKSWMWSTFISSAKAQIEGLAE